MYELCAPVLYTDCTPYDFVSFATGLRTNENIDRTSRLHIHHKQHWAEVTYAQIFESGWSRLETKRALHVNPIGRDFMGVLEECHALVEQGVRIRRFITQGLTILPKLQIVSMGGIGEDLFNSAWGSQAQAMYSCDFENTGKVLSHALIDLPTIKDYCQTVAYGPLALPNKIIKVKSSLQTFTYHLRGAGTFSRCPTAQQIRSPPIIIGAMNRYFCQLAVHASYPLDRATDDELVAHLEPIIAMFNRPAHTADSTTGESIDYNGDINAFRGTKVEIYDYIRTVDKAKLDSSGRACLDPTEVVAALPPQSLSFLQGTLDEALPEQWKGKVVFKNREDAPLCPACGLSLQEEFEDWLDFYKSIMA